MLLANFLVAQQVWVKFGCFLGRSIVGAIAVRMATPAGL